VHPGGDERKQINEAIEHFMERVREVMEAHVQGRAIKAHPVDALGLIDQEPYIAALKYGMRTMQGYGVSGMKERTDAIIRHAVLRMRDVGALSSDADAVPKAQRVLALLLKRMEAP
jgi:hypothetical protein